MLEAVQLNANHRNGDLKLYEFGNCYFYDATAAMPEEPLKAYSEQFRLAIAVTGIAAPSSWNRKPEQASFFTLRAIAEKLLRPVSGDLYTLESPRSDLYGDALPSLNDKARELVQIASFRRSCARLRPETRCLLSGDGFRGPGQGYTQE